MLQVVSQTNGQYPKGFHTADRMFHPYINTKVGSALKVDTGATKSRAIS